MIATTLRNPNTKEVSVPWVTTVRREGVGGFLSPSGASTFSLERGNQTNVRRTYVRPGGGPGAPDHPRPHTDTRHDRQGVLTGKACQPVDVNGLATYAGARGLGAGGLGAFDASTVSYV